MTTDEEMIDRSGPIAKHAVQMVLIAYVQAATAGLSFIEVGNLKRSTLLPRRDADLCADDDQRDMFKQLPRVAMRP